MPLARSFSPPAGFLMDLDGTLVDTAPDIHAAGGRMLDELGLPPVPLELARSFIGNGMPRFVKRLLTGKSWANPDPDLFARAHELMLRHYARECAANPRVYPGARLAMAKLQSAGLRLACVTNKPRRFAEPLLDACGFNFRFLVCGDIPALKKPRPDGLKLACEKMKMSPADAVMVGDSAATDLPAAAAAGCGFVGVSYGYGARPFPPETPVIDRLDELLRIPFARAPRAPRAQSHDSAAA